MIQNSLNKPRRRKENMTRDPSQTLELAEDSKTASFLNQAPNQTFQSPISQLAVTHYNGATSPDSRNHLRLTFMSTKYQRSGKDNENIGTIATEPKT